MARILKDWLSAYLKYTENSEPKTSYHLWLGMAVIGAALTRRIYLRWGHQILYPNLYVVLVGPSGRAKKGTAMSFARPLLNEAGIHFISGAPTREVLIRRMAESASSEIDPTTGECFVQCATTCFSEELAVLLAQCKSNPQFLADLCDWYDCPDYWKYDTKTQGTDVLQRLFFNLVGAMAPKWFAEILPQTAIGGGFTSRIIFVTEHTKGKTVIIPTVDFDLQKMLIHDLQYLRQLGGEYYFGDEALLRYAEWYDEEEQKIRDGRPPIYDPVFEGYCDRRATHIKKLCLILQASYSDSPEIEAATFERALTYLEAVEKKMPQTFIGLGQSRIVEAQDLVLNHLVKHRVATGSQILQLFHRDIDAWTLDIVTRSVTQMLVVEVEILRDSSGKKVDTLYKLVEDKYNEMAATSGRLPYIAPKTNEIEEEEEDGTE